MAETQSSQFKRRQYFIDRKFQTHFILKFLLILVVGGCLSIALTVLTTQETLTSSFDGSKLAIQKTSLAILPSVILTNIITTGIIAVIALVVTLVVSHKIAGPMFRFEQDLKNIADGDLQKKIHIRNGDQFGGVAANLNTMVESLNARITIVQDDLDRLAQKAVEQNLPQSFIRELEECKNKIDSQFRI